MILRLAVRSLATRPVRTAVLAGGFGFGIGVMATLLGVGEVILEQASAPALLGGGDLLISGAAGNLPNARFLTSSVLTSPPLAIRVASVSPWSAARLYLIHGDSTTAVSARGGIPSRERALGDEELARTPGWIDTDTDRRWSSPDPGEVLRAMDRFHPIPNVPSRAASWAEWLYFNGRGRGGAPRFTVTFFVGPRLGQGRRAAAVRLQVERDAEAENFSAAAEIDEATLLQAAPDLTIGGSRVRLEGLRYRITLALDAERGGPGARGEIYLDAVPGRALPPVLIRGARGWLSGYVVPVLSGDVAGDLRVGNETIRLQGAMGYHDHNWGFWEGVTWQWGQVAADDLSFVYGRLRPPADAADPERVPGFLAVLGPQGPLGYSTDVAIEESGASRTTPQSLTVRARGAALDLRLQASTEGVMRTRLGGPFAARGDHGSTLLQIHALYRVRGRVGDRRVDFTARGSAETFRGRSEPSGSGS